MRVNEDVEDTGLFTCFGDGVLLIFDRYWVWLGFNDVNDLFLFIVYSSLELGKLELWNGVVKLRVCGRLSSLIIN